MTVDRTKVKSYAPYLLGCVSEELSIASLKSDQENLLHPPLSSSGCPGVLSFDSCCHTVVVVNLPEVERGLPYLSAPGG